MLDMQLMQYNGNKHRVINYVVLNRHT